MIKEIKIIGIDCPNCYKNLENELKKIEDIKNLNYNFITQKCSFEVNDINVEKVILNIDKLINKLELEYEIIK